MDCLFCGIAQGAIPSETVFEDDSVRVIRDIHPKAPVHLLVLPKVHVESIAHLEDDHADMITRMIHAAKRVAADQGLQGYKLVLNVGREGGQVIGHLHLHILGGWARPEERRVNV